MCSVTSPTAERRYARKFPLLLARRAVAVRRRERGMAVAAPLSGRLHGDRTPWLQSTDGLQSFTQRKRERFADLEDDMIVACPTGICLARQMPNLSVAPCLKRGTRPMIQGSKAI